MESAFAWDVRISAHASRRSLSLGPKTCSLFTLITIWPKKCAQSSFKKEGPPLAARE